LWCNCTLDGSKENFREAVELAYSLARLISSIQGSEIEVVAGVRKTGIARLVSRLAFLGRLSPAERIIQEVAASTPCFQKVSIKKLTSHEGRFVARSDKLNIAHLTERQGPFPNSATEE